MMYTSACVCPDGMNGLQHQDGSAPCNVGLWQELTNAEASTTLNPKVPFTVKSELRTPLPLPTLPVLPMADAPDT